MWGHIHHWPLLSYRFLHTDILGQSLDLCHMAENNNVFWSCSYSFCNFYWSQGTGYSLNIMFFSKNSCKFATSPLTAIGCTENFSQWLCTRIPLRALKVSYSNVGEGGVSVNYERNNFSWTPNYNARPWQLIIFIMAKIYIRKNLSQFQNEREAYSEYPFYKSARFWKHTVGDIL